MATVALKSAAGKWIMVPAILASAMAFIDGTALNVVLPSLQKNLNASAADLFWLLNAYLLMLASLILVGGSLGDKLGRKMVFMLGILIFIVGSAACGFAPTVFFLIIFRIVQGIGGALMIPGSLSLISSSINDNEKGKAIGTWSSITTVVTMGGPILGGILGDAGLWRYIFFINVPIGLAALAILSLKVKESRDEDADNAVDIAGAIAIALSLALITFGFLRIPSVGIDNPQACISLLTGVLLLIIFLYIEKKSKHPMMPLQLFSNPIFTGVNLLTFFLYAGLGAGMLFLSLNLVQAQGYSQLRSGLSFLPFTILMIALARYAGTVADRYGPRWLLVFGPATTGTGLLILSFVKQTTGPDEYWTTFFPGILVFGLGMSATVAPLTATVMGSVSGHLSGTASGVNNALTRIANVFANAILGAMAVLFFTSTLQNEIKAIPMDTKVTNSVMAQAANLGDAKAPEGISPVNQRAIVHAYQQSFIHAYANILQIAAGLAFLGSLTAYTFVHNNILKKE